MPPTDEPLDPLSDRLRDDRYLPDDGFTARTLQRLPGPRRTWRRWVLGTAAMVAVLTAALLSTEVVALVGKLWRATASATGSVSGSWSFAALAIAIVVALAMTLAILRDEAW